MTKDTTKQQVGEYFSDLGKKPGEASGELEKVAEKASSDVDKEGILNKGIRAAVDSAKMTLSVLKGHLESLKGIGDDNVVGEAASNVRGVASAELELKKAYKALKGIVDTADKEGVAKLVAGDLAVKLGNADNKDGVKILATDNAPAVGDSGKASIIVSSVSGEEILVAIVKSEEGDTAAAIAANVDGTTSALKFDKGGTAANLANEEAKARAVSGGIALRSLVKDGKLASGAADNSAGGKEEVQKVGITAVNKLLGAVEEIIKKTVKNVLEKAKEKIDKVREPKTAIK